MEYSISVKNDMQLKKNRLKIFYQIKLMNKGFYKKSAGHFKPPEDINSKLYT